MRCSAVFFSNSAKWNALLSLCYCSLFIERHRKPFACIKKHLRENARMDNAGNLSCAASWGTSEPQVNWIYFIISGPSAVAFSLYTKGCWTMKQACSVMLKTVFNALHKLNKFGLRHCFTMESLFFPSSNPSLLAHKRVIGRCKPVASFQWNALQGRLGNTA